LAGGDKSSQSKDTELALSLTAISRSSATPKAAMKPIATKTTTFDVAEHLRTSREMSTYLDAWFNEAPDDAQGIAGALGDIARAKGISQVAKDAGLSRENLYKALSADGNPSFATILKVAKALGLRLHTQPLAANA
jgi:probable addiction module antidote protein